MVPGGFGYYTLMHEIGHAVGLRHAGPYDGTMPASFAPGDTAANTVMSYNLVGYPNPTSLGPFDHVALRTIYGASGSGSGATQAWDPVTGIMRDDGTENADILIGINKTDIMIGDAGNDLMLGRAGDDSMDGGAGNDSMNGGYGIDSLAGGTGNDTMLGGDDTDWLDGGPGDDVLMSDDGSRDTVIGGDGNDLVAGGNGANWVDGGSGDDILYGSHGADTLWGGTGNDLIYGDIPIKIPFDAVNVVFGGDGNDTVYGGDNLDIVFGEAGNDRLHGNPGADSLDGGGGDDTLRGDPDAATWPMNGFLLYASDTINASLGHDVVEDFRHNSFERDRIRFANNVAGLPAITGFGDVMQRATTVDGSTVIDLGTGNSLTLQGVPAASLREAYFIFG